MKNWLKAAIPPAIAAAIVATTLITHAVQQPDPSEPTYLSPIARTDDGAAALADRLTQQGVAVQRRTSTPEALAAATTARNATIFVPAPEMIRPEYLDDFRIVPPSVRIVLVAPNRSVLSKLDALVPQAGPRWTAAAPDPGCNAAFATGRAAVLRWQYAPAEGQLLSCYNGGVVEVDRGGPPITLVGAPDPFRNDRQGEWSNADFAVELLGRGSTVVWLDLHEREPGPPPDQVNGEPAGPDEGDRGEVGNGDESGDSSDSRSDQGQGQSEGDPSARQQPDEQSVLDAFPQAFWAAVLLVILAMVAFAAASARRLGAPVTEPLPARVRASETVRGLAGLYRRAGARDASLATVQAAALRRLAAHFDLPLDLDAVSNRVAAELNLPAEEVRGVLVGEPEDTDDDLVLRAAAVQRLVSAVLGDEKGKQ
ncbi:DUF4350 domain-containing protein [Actinoplanes sp. NBRC 103695]|uniref:DUF4350 domain-containing protein n=1 Tax=Actinoplanes sp. NBRC 103695 TaxID=3032202 RepID=UPI0024A2B046|nr:DUF4350 domain-containing protein [Actinoplanes sp. NBRC 103695]GLY97725.1 hypothetical protein Acsp02_49790 [Actinoplanes sp. NBRC 103695]